MTNPPFLWFIFIVSLLCMQCQSTVITGECLDYEQCMDQTLNAKAECMSWKSCYGSTIDTTHPVNCGAYMACAGSSSIKSSNNIDCSAWNACSDKDYDIPISSTDGTVDCSGYFSCVDAVIEAKDAECNGYYSCTQATIEVQNSVQCNSHYSCRPPVINAPTGSVECNAAYSCRYSYGGDIRAKVVSCGGW
eukprot:80216_1